MIIAIITCSLDDKLFTPTSSLKYVCVRVCRGDIEISGLVSGLAFESIGKGKF